MQALADTHGDVFSVYVDPGCDAQCSANRHTPTLNITVQLIASGVILEYVSLWEGVTVTIGTDGGGQSGQELTAESKANMLTDDITFPCALGEDTSQLWKSVLPLRHHWALTWCVFHMTLNITEE